MQVRALVKAITHSRYLLKTFDTKTKRTRLVEVKQSETKIRSLEDNHYEMCTGDLTLLITKSKYNEMIS